MNAAEEEEDGREDGGTREMEMEASQVRLLPADSIVKGVFFFFSLSK